MPQEVLAYVVRGDRLLVFTHADDEPWNHSGVHVPSGTVRPGELPQDAVLREATDNTGLEGLRVERFLGTAEYDMRPSADAVHVRHFFQLSTRADDVLGRWFVYEKSTRSGDARETPVGSPRFHLYWIPLSRAHVLSAGQAALIGRMSD